VIHINITEDDRGRKVLTIHSEGGKEKLAENVFEPGETAEITIEGDDILEFRLD
jgi:hypothetical protein